MEAIRLPPGPEPKRLSAQPRRHTGIVPVTNWDTLTDRLWWMIQYPLGIMKWRDRHHPASMRVQRESEAKYRSSAKGQAAIRRKREAEKARRRSRAAAAKRKERAQ